MRRTIARWAALAALATLVTGTPALSQQRFITVVSTTSTENSGLFARILPIFTARTGIEVRVVAVGTGRALGMARNGDADVLFVHHRPSEQAFVAQGYGVERFAVMYNDFVIVGPGNDPADVTNAVSVTEALSRIARSGTPFISRGDDSGTHKRELALWNAAGIDPVKDSGGWYQEVGAGMGAALNISASKQGYTLSDRGTWLSFGRRHELAIVNEGDQRLLNPYGIILVNPQRFTHVKAADGQRFIEWLLSAEGQQAIADYRIDGEQLFFPNPS